MVAIRKQRKRHIRNIKVFHVETFVVTATGCGFQQHYRFEHKHGMAIFTDAQRARHKACIVIAGPKHREHCVRLMESYDDQHSQTPQHQTPPDWVCAV